MPANDEEWWRQACEEIGAARDLKDVGRHATAYHHAGQAVEFALKAIYLRRQGLPYLPDECRGAQWHDLNLIAARAGLNQDLGALNRKGPIYENWLTVRDWDSNARFPGNKRPQKEVTDLFVAACHEQNGVMKWLESIFQP